MFQSFGMRLFFWLKNTVFYDKELWRFSTIENWKHCWDTSHVEKNPIVSTKNNGHSRPLVGKLIIWKLYLWTIQLDNLAIFYRKLVIDICLTWHRFLRLLGLLFESKQVSVVEKYKISPPPGFKILGFFQ